jgi:flagellar motility protein MotE (MotC chaperone)
MNRTSGKRRFLTSRSVILPIVSAGMLALAPWQAADLFHRWQTLAQAAPPAAQPAGAGVAAAGPNLAASSAPPSATVQRPADGKLLEELNRRSAELDRREHDLRTWAAQVAVAERLARAQLAELGQLRIEVEKVMAQESAASDQDLDVLVGLYSNMKPTQAAAVLGRLDASKAAAILEKLDIRSAGPALAAMDPSVAVAITEELTRRHAPFRK